LRECFGRSDPVWSLIGFFAHGRLLAAPRAPLRSLKFGLPPALPRPARPVTMQTKPAFFMPAGRHPADQAVTLPRKRRRSICILDEAIVGKIGDGQQARCAPYRG
jgi:hypothetical protein